MGAPVTAGLATREGAELLEAVVVVVVIVVVGVTGFAFGGSVMIELELVIVVDDDDGDNRDDEACGDLGLIGTDAEVPSSTPFCCASLISVFMMSFWSSRDGIAFSVEESEEGDSVGFEKYRSL